MFDIIVRRSFSFIYSPEDFTTSTRYDSEVAWIANDRVALTRSCLAIGKHAHVIPFKGVIKQLDSKILEYAILVSIAATR